MTFKQATIDGKMITYHEQTEFLIQVGKRKGSYQTRYTITGNISEAVFYYRCLNIGNGYKKRIFVPSFNKPLLARQFS